MSCPHHHSNPCCCCHCYNPCSNDQQISAILLQSPSPLPPHIPITSFHSSSSQYLQSNLHPFAYHQHPQQRHEDQKRQEEQSDVVHSLLQRIAALESALPHFSQPLQNPFSPPPKHPRHAPEPPRTVKATPLASPCPQPTTRAAARRSSIRDLAARTIQVAFRRFLVRRSQILHYLKDLAVIKSRVAALKPALSSGGGRCHDPRALSQAFMDLLAQLDSIQSGDPMIREGKRSISRELVRILDFIDKFMLKEHPEAEAKDRDLNEGGHTLARAGAKRVSFSKNRKGLTSSLYDGDHCNVSGEEDGYVEGSGEGYAGIHARDHLEELQHVSDDERSSESSIAENAENKYVNGGHFKTQSSKRGLSAPMPAQMEPWRN